MKIYDVFISYRREEKDGSKLGTQIAEALYNYLKMKGLCVFLDVKEMDNGLFPEQLRWHVTHAPNYIFIATDAAMKFRDVTPPDTDYVAEEMRLALKLYEENPKDRVILPVIPHNVSVPEDSDSNYPPEIHQLFKHNTPPQLKGASPNNADLNKIQQLSENLPDVDDLKDIHARITKVNRGNLWNAGNRWLEEMTKPGSRFATLSIDQTIMPLAGNEKKENNIFLPIRAHLEEKQDAPLMDMIRDTKGHLYLIGEGGIGKTTALFSIMKKVYGPEKNENDIERYRFDGQVPLFVELSKAPDTYGRLYEGGRSTFIQREVYRQLRQDLKVKQMSSAAVQEINEVFNLDPDTAVKPIHDLFTDQSPAPEYLLLLDGLNEVSRTEIGYKYKDDDGTEKTGKMAVVSMVLQEIKQLMEECPNVRVILTSRSKEQTTWSEKTTMLYLSGVKDEAIESYLKIREIPDARIAAMMQNEKFTNVLRIPLFLTLYAALEGDDEILTRGEILHLFFHQKKEKLYTAKARNETVDLDVDHAAFAKQPDRLTADMQSFILDFILPEIAWRMEQEGEFYIQQKGKNGNEGLRQIILRVLTDRRETSVCGENGKETFAEYNQHTGKNNTRKTAKALCERLRNGEEDEEDAEDEIVSGILENAVFSLGILQKNGGANGMEYGFIHHHLRDYFAAVHQINSLRLAVYLHAFGEDDLARDCLADWREHPLHSEVRRFIGEALGEAHNAPICDGQGNWHYTVPKEPCNRNLIKRGFDIYRGRFDGQDGYAVWNLIEILKNVRDDLSGGDFTSLDLTKCEINGYSLGKLACSAQLNGAQVNDDFFMPKGHTEDIYTACYSPDGRCIVTASDDYTAKVWDAETLQVLGTLKGHSDAVNSAIYSPDGNRIITASRDKTAIIWDAKTLQIIGPLKGHENEIKYACYSRNGDRIVTASLDGSVIIWDAESRNILCTLKHENDPQKSKAFSGINFACFSPDGNKVVTAGVDGIALIWNAKTFEKSGMLKRQPLWVKTGVDGQKIVTYPGKGSTMPEWYSDWLSFHSIDEDKYRITIAASVGMGGVYDVIDRETSQSIGWLEEPFESVYSASYSPDGRRIITANDDGTIVVWDAETLQEIKTLREHDSNLRFTYACYSPDGCSIIAASPNGVFIIWDAVTFQKKGILKGYTQSHFGAFVSYSSNGRKIVTAGWGVKIWQSESMQEVGRLKRYNGFITYACYSPDNQKIITTRTDGTALLWDALTFRVFGRLKGHSDVIWSANFSSDNRKVLTASKDGTSKIWDVITLQEVGSLKVNNKGILNSSYSPDTKTIVTTSQGIDSYVWDAKTVQRITELESRFTTLSSHLHPGFSYPFSPNGQTIIIGSDPGSAKIWDVKSFEEIGILKGCSKGVQSASYSPNGCKIITGSGDTIEIWDAVNLQKIDEIKSNVNSPIISVCYSPDELRILSVFFNGTLKIWDAEDKKEVFTLKDTNNACYSYDGDVLVTVSEEKVIIRNAITFEPLHTINNISGLEVYGVDLRHLHSASRLSDEIKERLYEYGAIVDERG